MTIDTDLLPPADAEQAHLVDEITHEADYDHFQHGDFPHRCGACGQPMPGVGAR
jgi:hypothetical protein